MRPQEIQAIIQANASKSKGHDIVSQGEIDETKFEEF